MFSATQRLAQGFQPTVRRLATGFHPDEAAKPLAPGRNPKILVPAAIGAGLAGVYMLRGKRTQKERQGEHVGQMLEGAVPNYAHTPEHHEQTKKRGMKQDSAGV